MTSVKKINAQDKKSIKASEFKFLTELIKDDEMEYAKLVRNNNNWLVMGISNKKKIENKFMERRVMDTNNEHRWKL